MLRVCVLLVVVCIFGVGSLRGRGFLCRDPDTGKLHHVNTTWPASSFCGNYHCKLRRKNITETEYAPMRQINITNIKLLGNNLTEEDLKNETVFITKEEAEKSVITTNKKTEPDIRDEIIPLDRNVDIDIEENLDDRNETERGDRYLSDKEIRSLTEILHSVRKSDLDAIVEIYNLAQDIYKEINKTGTDHVLNEAVHSTKTATNQKIQTELIRKRKKHGHVSYWYEPLANGKIRPADLMRGDISRPETMRNDMIPVVPAMLTDMEKLGSNNILLAQKPSPASSATLPPTANQIWRITDSYFNGPLSNKDFGKLPYYYPMSNFQRMSSYVHQQSKMANPNKPIVRSAYQPVSYAPPPLVYGGGKLQKEIKPSVLLPYPFSNIHHYNWSHPQNLYNKNSLVETYDLHKKEKNHVARRTFVQKPKNAVLMNPDLENFQDLEIKPSIKEESLAITSLLQKFEEDRRRPDWQTDSLPTHILEEVRAHMQDKQRLLIHPFPLRKKVKLERVGKLLKLDDLTRSKRSAGQKVETSERPLEPELFEVYIEKTTCNPDDTTPGYFRYGNLSQPYPGCCPQRISIR